jgi:hypothetical protein
VNMKTTNTCQERRNRAELNSVEVIWVKMMWKSHFIYAVYPFSNHLRIELFIHLHPNKCTDRNDCSIYESISFCTYQSPARSYSHIRDCDCDRDLATQTETDPLAHWS